MELNQSDSLSGREEILRAAINEEYAEKKEKKEDEGNCVPCGCGAWIRDVFSNAVVVDHKGKKYAHTYTIKDGKAKLGKRTEVTVSYKPVKGSASTKDDWDKLVDKS